MDYILDKEAFNDPSAYLDLYNELSVVCKQYNIQMFDKVFPSRRLSCVFTKDIELMNQLDANSSLYSYGHIPKATWDKSLMITSIKDTIKQDYDIDVDYCLAHIYRDGTDYIGWHTDKEAWSSPVISVSFGATRKFKVRAIKATKGWDTEFDLTNGSLLIMNKGFQRKYKHTVPVQKKITTPRLNLTFRQFDNSY